MPTCINWNSLPCLLTKKDGEDKAVVFTNIEGDLVACEIPKEKLNDEETKIEITQAGGFDCLGRTMPLQDEFTLVLSLTERCNAACRYCFLDAQTSGNVMTKEILYAAIDYVARHIKGREINLAAFGGEPSVAPELVKEMVKYGKKVLSSPYKFSITTNGYFDDDFCDFLIEHNFHISLSMDGIPKVQEVQRPSSIPISQLEKNIRRLAASTCELKIRCTVTEFACKYMLDTVKYLQKMGVTRVHFEPVTPGGRAQIQNAFTSQPLPDYFVGELFKCIDYGAENGVDVICFPYMNMLMAPVVFCDGNINNRLVIGATGVVSTCVEVQNTKHVLFPALGIGAYDETKKSFVFDYAERRPFCRGCSSLVKNPECTNCAFVFFCAGGCPTRNYRGSDSTEIISDYRCRIMKQVMPVILEKYYYATYDEE
ncbi:MAG: radical SAM protein [Lachnospiraceae bacterium]|nr:radical SAM protein [Lachnospiraceae bacterium]